MDTMVVQEQQKKHSRLSVTIPFLLLGALAAGYAGLCAYAASSGVIWKNTEVLGQDLGGLTVTQAARKLDKALPNLKIGVYLYNAALDKIPERASTPDAYIALSDLGVTADTSALAQSAYQKNLHGSFLTLGWRYLTNSGASCDAADMISPDAEQTLSSAQTTADSLSYSSQDTSFEMEDSALLIHMGKDGRTVDSKKLAQGLKGGNWDRDLSLDVSYVTQSAQTMTAQQIYDQVSGEMKNAGYDAATQSILPEKTGAEFDVVQAQSMIASAAPGDTLKIPAVMEYPAVTSEQLKPVLFRDLLGSYTTHVGGSAARISNVKLASASLNGTVLNSGDIFDYNEVVGQRTIARGYQPAPAYVQGETVDEIGGGVCQPSSTLYLATLKSNLEIVERYAHRYVPAYIPKGMDATVSWGGPNYRFRNNTDYPVKIQSVYSKGYLTMTLYGTKTDDVTVKMSNKVLSTTEYKTVYEDDPALPAGAVTVKTTPYTGYKVETYRNLYDGSGKLISSDFEASSDYKVRNKVISKGPSLPSVPTEGNSSEIPVPVTPYVTPESGTEAGTTPETPSTTPENGATPVTPETPIPSEESNPSGADPNSVISPLPSA
ncbi:VanW family protein [Oscillibacter sp.]|uniref:VanW family protein n=1 Tax=Oscillibacter sp. TaxID=1945593 RepID=UPI0033920D36